MTPPTLAQQERNTLCDLFVELGSEAPTLCEGWSTADLAAHLVVRERRPDSGPGLVWPRWPATPTRCGARCGSHALGEVGRERAERASVASASLRRADEHGGVLRPRRRRTSCATRLGTPPSPQSSPMPCGRGRARRDGEESPSYGRYHLTGTSRQRERFRAAPDSGGGPRRADHVRRRPPRGSKLEISGDAELIAQLRSASLGV